MLSRDHPIKLFATSRKGEDLGLESSDGRHAIVYPQLDVESEESIHAFTDLVRSHGQVDALINNAGVNLDSRYSPETARQTLNVNYRGTLDVCRSQAMTCPATR
jgi:carbonyl reductase 1